MEIASNFDAKLLTSIARDSESKQAVKDVSYASYITYKSKAKLYCEHTDNSFIIGTLCKNIFASSVWLHAPATSIKGLRKNF